MQTKITRNLPVNDTVFNQKADFAQKHAEAFKEHSTASISKAVIYEFGGGYDMLVPLNLFIAGAKRQMVTDVNPLLKPALINNAMHRLGLRGSISATKDLQEKFGIDYRAPVDACNTGLPGGSIDFIHSTDTLEHIPQRQILSILKECFRLLKTGGIISCMIDVQDHYAYFDKNLSPFNFYKYSPLVWQLFFNNRLQYQNRLRPSDYEALFVHTGFELVNIEAEFAPNGANAGDIKIHPYFKYYSLQQLNSTRCLIVGRKA